MLKVTTPSQTEDLTTLDTVKAELGITKDTSDDNLSRYISDASAICADYCNTTFGLAGYLETFMDGGDGTDKLLLSRRPLVEVSSVTENGKALEEDTDYMVDEENGILYRLPKATGWSWTQGGGYPYGWWPSASPIVVAYTAGYDLLDSLPRAIERACLGVIREVYFSASRDPTLQSVSIPDVIDRRFSSTRGDTSTEAALSKTVTDLLDRYRRLFSAAA